MQLSTVAQIMTRDIVVIHPEQTVLEAAQLMEQHHIGALPVHDGMVVGVLSERDILKRVIIPQKDPATTQVDQVMTRIVVSIDPDKPYYDALELMTTAQVKKLVVIKDEKPIGMVTQTDLLKYLAKAWADDPATHQ